MERSAKEFLLAQRAKFKNTPLNYREQTIQNLKKIRVAESYYDSWDGHRVKALLTEPLKPGTSPALIFAHPFSGDVTTFLPDAISYAKAGFISLIIEAPFKRKKPYLMEMDLKNPKTVRAGYLQWIGDIIKGYDLLEQSVIVDQQKMGFIGRNIGASLTGILTAVEERVQATAYQAGLPQLSHFWKSGDSWAVYKREQEVGRESLNELAVQVADMDFLANIGDSHCASWLCQFGDQDHWIPPNMIQLLGKEIPTKSDIRIYDDDYRLSTELVRMDLLAWLKEEFMSKV